MVVIGDDIALEGHGSGSVGRRGLAGAVLVMKVRYMSARLILLQYNCGIYTN